MRAKRSAPLLCHATPIREERFRSPLRLPALSFYALFFNSPLKLSTLASKARVSTKFSSGLFRRSKTWPRMRMGRGTSIGTWACLIVFALVASSSHGHQPLARIAVHEVVIALDGRASIKASPSILGVTGKMWSGCY
ncbi:hypothetical protein BT93_L4235 [Corymbia citriodora subsp. variegata]|uniref:Uncharacterized protein n=1 Tax=Corymbia citriodora subsp. variegata TaxID=360336 RepID=A0A8T0CYX4_CORYI|nr:hypothetical protein BT93_L4235 [Corymbia citriodora subsp. variegata]